MGAFVDYTDKRLLLGKIASVSFCCLLVPPIFISSEMWFAVAICLLAAAFVGWVQTMVTYAYLPELTDSEQHLTQYTQSFSILQFASMVLLLVVVIGISTVAGFGNDDVATARLAQSISLVLNTVLLYIAWLRLFQRRPPLRQIPAGQTLFTAGFIQIYGTCIHIFQHLPALKWFYVSVSFIDAGINSLTTILVTYLTDTLAFTARENGLVILIVLLSGVPGSLLAGYTLRRWKNPVRSSIAATMLLATTTIIFAIVVTGPQQQLETYILATGWGLPVGWKWTVDRLMASTFIPAGQDAELMGTFLFAGQVLSWLPPLIFTVLNEAGVSQSIGIGTLAIWFGLGIASLLAIGNYQDAIIAVGRENLLSPSPPLAPSSSSSSSRHDGSPETNEHDGGRTAIPAP
jgi:MFS transporter, UMF1 family